MCSMLLHEAPPMDPLLSARPVLLQKVLPALAFNVNVFCAFCSVQFILQFIDSQVFVVNTSEVELKGESVYMFLQMVSFMLLKLRDRLGEVK